MFENLTQKFEKVLSGLKKNPILKEEDIKTSLKEIRVALLEADVSLGVVKNFVKTIEKKSTGKEIIKSTSANQTIIKIVNDEIINLLGKNNEEINLKSNPPVSLLILGLQGSGKTTTSAKLAKFIEKNYKKKLCLLASMYIDQQLKNN